MDPKENDTQTPLIDDQAQQPTAQQKADGELVVPHEAEVGTTIPGSDEPTNNTSSADGSDAMGTDVGNGIPTDPFTPPEAPAAPMTGQPTTPVGSPLTPDQPVQPLSQTDQAAPLQPFPTAAPTPTEPAAIPPAMPTDPNIPATPPVETGPPAGGVTGEHKSHTMMVLLILIGAVVVLGLGVYAIMQL